MIATGSSHPIRFEPMLIGGQFVAAADGRVLEVENPARRERLATVPRSTAEDVDRAVGAAASAFETWRRMPPRDRGKLLLKIADSLERAAADLACTIASETGNALRTQARPEAATTIDIFRYFGGLAGELKGVSLPLGESVLSYSRREPLGVVGAIVPWNAPVMLSALKIAPAVCAGNTIVLKAAEDAPLGVLMLARACQEHLPPGVVNVVTGFGDECGEALLAHPGIQKLTFTGSTGVGKRVMRAAAERILPVSLELGGKSPSIVCEDADLEWAHEGVITAMRFTRQGQSCTAGSRLFVHASIFDDFLSHVSRRLSALKIGDPLDEATDMGSIISQRQYTRVCDYIREGLESPGARLVCGGLPKGDGSQGFFVEPTLFAHTDGEWRLSREEIFGPVLVAVPWREEREVIALANRSHYGLAAFVWTKDVGRALRIAHQVDAGWVQVNQGGGQVLGQSYGGYKQSGLGREFSLESMLESFTQAKSITVNMDR